MFDYVMFLNYGSILLGAIFIVRALAGIASWYYYCKTPTGRLDYMVNYTMKGLQITSWNIGKNFLYVVICILVFFSIK